MSTGWFGEIKLEHRIDFLGRVISGKSPVNAAVEMHRKYHGDKDRDEAIFAYARRSHFFNPAMGKEALKRLRGEIEKIKRARDMGQAITPLIAKLGTAKSEREKQMQKPKKESVPIAHRIRAVELLLQWNSMTSAARILKKELGLPHPEAKVRALFFPPSGLYAVPRYYTNETLEKVKAKLQRVAAAETTGRIYGTSKKLRVVTETSLAPVVVTPLKVKVAKPLPPLEQVQAALKEKALKHSIERGGKVIIPFKGNVASLQDLVGQHNVEGGMYEVAVRKYLQALRIPGHKVEAKWVERQQLSEAKPKPPKPTAKPFGKDKPKPTTKPLDDEEDSEAERGEEKDEPDAPTTVSEDVVEIHVQLKKK
ncbi:MAG: hypothetical protein Q8R15_00455 [Candidatus Micrarchaeota archaeon]|nr:hypothetical protein [Candidatus Micrarchaeota archaeon]